jgi:hypothetical protein
MLWCESVAPLGKPVVPEVYWMLIGSSALSSIAASAPRSARRPVQSGAARPDLGDHRGIVGRLQPLRGDEQSGARLGEHELELAGPVGGVDVHQDRADLRGGVLGQHPFGAVRGPDAHPVPHGDAGGEQAESERVHVGGEFGVAPPAAGRHVDQGRAIGEPAHCRVEVLPDRVAEQRRVADGRRVALLRHGVLLSPLRAS